MQLAICLIKKYFEDFNLWFEKFNVIMNANDMNFRQKRLKDDI